MTDMTPYDRTMELVAQIANTTGMPRMSCYTIAILWEARGRVITQSLMAERLGDISGGRPDLLQIATHLKRARRKLPPCVTITTLVGIGWSASSTQKDFSWEEYETELRFERGFAA